MARSVSILYTLKDNFTNSLRNIQSEQKRFEKNVQRVSQELTTLYDKKRNLKLDNKAADKAIKDTAKNATKLGDQFQQMMKGNVSKKSAVASQLDEVNKKIKDTEKNLTKMKSINSQPKIKIRDEASSTINNISSKLLNLAKAAVVVGGVTTILNKVKDVGLYSLNLAGQREQSQMAFETMLKSKEAGQKMLKDLTTFAIKTPYEYADLEKNATFALAMGFKQGDLLSLLTDVGDASSGLGKGAVGVENIVRALGQMKNKGKVSMQEMNQLAENGVKALEYLSKSTGKSTAEMIKYIEDGIVPADKAIEAIRKGMKGDFGGMMIKQSTTLLGLWSSLKDFANLNVFTAFGEGIRKGIMPYLTRFVDKLTNGKDGMDNFQKKLTNAGKTIGDFLASKADGLMKYFDKLYSNEQFRNADLGGKIKIVLNDMYDGMNEWYNGGGGEDIKNFFSEMAQNAVDILVVTLETAVPKIADIGLKVGDAMLQGIGKGLDKKIPFQSEREVIDSKLDDFGIKELTKKLNPARVFTGGMIIDAYNNYKNYKDMVNQNKNSKPKAMGVNRVPYNNYPAMLHEGEQVLTKQEVNGNKGRGLIIEKLADTLIVREEADIDKIADKLVRKFQEAQLVHGGAF